MKKLVLFDIDGTLVDSHRAGTRSMLQALAEEFGREVSVDGYSMAGCTDAQIVVELMSRAGVEAAETIARLERIWERYVVHLDHLLAERAPTCYPGVEATVARVARTPEVLVGLLTGNVERGARSKLRRCGLDRWFRLGAYGDSVTERAALPAIALEEAERVCGRRFQGAEIVIIGDTPNDILCGRPLGVRAVAVATGPYTESELADHDPARVLPDMGDVDRAVEAILDD